jgi:putative endonuclease
LTREDVEARVWEHNNDPIDGYTARRRPVTLVFCEVYDRLTDAIARERQIKGWTRKKKEALIRGDYEALPDLASRPLRPDPEVRGRPPRASKERKAEG